MFINENKIIAWFQDKSELDQSTRKQSIIAKPFPISNKNYINKTVKFRESFRPFAPAVLDEYKNQYFHLNQSSPNMLVACKVRKNKKYSIPAVIHVDGTSRVQTVSKSSNPKFYKLIQSVNKKTGIPVILNTSFNIKGQPIVNTPKNAIDCFKI